MNQYDEFLRATDVINFDHAAVRQQAVSLRCSDDPIAIARACFEWVRDEVKHSCDYQLNPPTCRASEVLEHRTGYCYAKSHLLAALLRANGLPAGFCYQRLSVGDSGPPYCLHGLNAVALPCYGWYRMDARGNRADIDAQFTPPFERLAFKLQSVEECEFENILPAPLPCVVEVLETNRTWQEILAHLPDLTPAEFGGAGLQVRATGDVITVHDGVYRERITPPRGGESES